MERYMDGVDGWVRRRVGKMDVVDSGAEEGWPVEAEALTVKGGGGGVELWGGEQ